MKAKIQFTRSYPSEARTLCPSSLGLNPSGWMIIGKIEEDRYKWVSDFEATHPKYGWVKGSYETALEAKSKKALKHFMDNHPPELWDSKDI